MINKIYKYFARLFFWEIVNPYGKKNKKWNIITKSFLLKLPINYSVLRKYLLSCKKNKNFYDAEKIVMNLNRKNYSKNEILEIGRYLFSIGSYFKVVKYFDGDCKPNEVWGKYGRVGLECIAKSHLMMKDYISAVRFFQYWERKQRNNPVPKINLVMIYYATLDFIKAKDVLNEYLALKPKCPIGLAYKARLQDQKNNEKLYERKKRISEKHNCKIYYDFEMI